MVRCCRAGVDGKAQALVRVQMTERFLSFAALGGRRGKRDRQHGYACGNRFVCFSMSYFGEEYHVFVILEDYVCEDPIHRRPKLD